MKYAEKRISLVGWGETQVMLHTVNGRTGLSVFSESRLLKFGLTPWLHGHIAVLPVTERYRHGQEPLGENAEFIMSLRQSAFNDALLAIENQDVLLLAETVTTTYMAQQYMGAELLPHKGEIAKRFSGCYGVYVFPQPHAITAELKSNSVMAA